MIPASFQAGTYLPGLPAPVVTTCTPSSATTLARASMWGFISIRLTPKGLPVFALAARISARREMCIRDSCLAAARQALERGGVAPGEIGVCLVATVTPDFLSPAAACLLQKELGFPEDTICFDLNAACSGFVYALHTAECLLASTPRKYGLVLGAEILSRVMDFGDRSTCVLFGDGAGAALVEWGANYPSLHAVLGCRGNSEVLYRCV